MMEPVVTREPKIPKDFQFFFELVALGKARRLCDITDLELQKNLLQFIPTCFDFYEVEDIIEAVAEQYRDAPQDVYLAALKNAVANIWPPEQPQVVLNIQKGFCSLCPGKTSPVIWADYQVALHLYPQDIQEAFGLLPYDDKQKVFAAFEALGINFEGKLPNPGKDLNQALGKLRGVFNKTIGEGWPRRSPPKTRKPSTERTNQATELMEEHFVYMAVCDLIDGNFTNLDPVIGDEACEARPSVLIDIWFKILEKYNKKPILINSLKFGYCLRHLMDPEPSQLRDVWQIQKESQWSKEFVIWCNSVLGDFRDYLKLCKANTLASTMAADEWGIASYDRAKGVYTSEGRAARRHQLSCLSVDRIRAMAKTVLVKCPSQTGQTFWGQVLSVLQNVEAFKLDNDCKILALPIYETMRTVLAHELLCGRPIILSLYRIRYAAGTPDPYTLAGIHTIAYVPKGGTFVAADIDAIPPHQPCMSFIAYQLVNPLQPIIVPDGAGFFASEDESYLQNFVFCDFALQTMIYSAVHPPLPHDSSLNGVVTGNDCGRAQLVNLQICDGPWGIDTEFTRNSPFSLLEPVCDLAGEYHKLLNLGISCGLADMQYMKRPGGGVVCVRTDVSCAFTIHHINMQSSRQVQERNTRALPVGPLKQFHNFDEKKSFSTEEEAKNPPKEKKDKS
jgi:hypothetical protein